MAGEEVVDRATGMEVTEICGYLDIARVKRETERARGWGDSGTKGFEKAGCYRCNGLDTECDVYFGKKVEE